jgi:predicted membrane channel-forming protein YqfA (hemolysin III family)
MALVAQRSPDSARPRAVALLVAVAVAVAVMVLVPRIPQAPEYHAFADRRVLLHVPNALDVLSSAAFLAVGLLGLRVVRRRSAALPSPADRTPWRVLFWGVVATALGSAWYHLDPRNETLVWDRLPMAVSFMAMLAALASERLGVKSGRRLLWPLVLAGAASVAWWHVSELRGAGDLRPYLLVQVGALVAIPLLVALFPGPRDSGRAWIVALALYGVAKLLEVADAPVLHALGVSGHTLKHLVAAASIAWLVRMVWRRDLATG